MAARGTTPTQASSPARYVVRLGGSFRLTDARGGATPLPRSRKAQAMLAFLALAPEHSVTRERLIGLLWAERGEEQARASLRQALAELRALPIGAEDAMRIERRAVALAPGMFETDVDRALACAEAGDLAGVHAELDTMDGRLLDEFEGVDPGYDDWLLAERPRLTARLVERVLGCAARASEEPAARQVLTALQRFETGDETIVRLGLELDARAGDLAGLHRRYRHFESALRRDYDAAPSLEVQRLFRGLTAVGAVAAPAPTPAAPPSDAAEPPPPARGEPPIVIVAPFGAIDTQPEARLLADICRDDLEVALCGVSDLRVLSLPDRAPATLDAACAASVASYALNGNVRVAGDEYRVNLRLTAVESGLLVWSRQFAMAKGELGGVVDDIVARIAGAILPVVEREVGRTLAARADPDPTAYALYVQGRERQAGAASLADAREAAALFERAIADDPKLTNAYLSLARLYNTDFEQRMAGHDVAPLRERAFALCTEAASLDPANPHVHSRLGWCYVRRGDERQAGQRFERALELAPYHADRLNEVGFGFCHLGRIEEATRLMQRAFELNPFPPDDYFADFGVALMLAGEYARAEEQFEISRNESIHYGAVRVANLALLGATARLGAMAGDLRRRFRAVWQPATAPGDADFARAMLEFVPLHRERDRAVLMRGLHAAGFGF